MALAFSLHCSPAMILGKVRNRPVGRQSFNFIGKWAARPEPDDFQDFGTTREVSSIAFSLAFADDCLRCAAVPVDLSITSMVMARSFEKSPGCR
jgi:hypothetical protein